jgi:dynein heavy chain
MHLQHKDIIEAALPASIVVGPFYINTEGVRQGLSKKRKQLANAVLDLLAKKLRTQAEEVFMILMDYIRECL